MILPKSKWPKYLKAFEQLKGIAYGDCVSGEQFSHPTAHAHCETGWICLYSKSRIKNRLLMLHEVAHLISMKRYHCDSWRYALIDIGGTLTEFPVTKDLVVKDFRKRIVIG